MVHKPCRVDKVKHDVARLPKMSIRLKKKQKAVNSLNSRLEKKFLVNNVKILIIAYRAK